MYNIGNKTVCVKYEIVSTVLSECKTEKRNSQRKYGQPMEQTRVLFCTCDSGVVRCQSQYQYHFWQKSSMFEAYCLATVNQFCVVHEGMNG